MCVCVSFFPKQPSLHAVWLSSLCALSSDKIAALSQAIAYKAKGHLWNDRANRTDINRSQ